MCSLSKEVIGLVQVTDSVTFISVVPLINFLLNAFFDKSTVRFCNYISMFAKYQSD